MRIVYARDAPTLDDLAEAPNRRDVIRRLQEGRLAGRPNSERRPRGGCR